MWSFTKFAVGTALLFVAVVPLAVPSQASVVYSVDDGAAEYGVRSQVGDMVWLNAFTVAPGGERITEISVMFGTPSGSGLVGGETVTIVLWNDPNDDGNPSDAVVLASQSHTIVNFDIANEFDVVTLVTPTVVSGVFFVGVYANLPGIYVAGQDGDAPIGSASWLAVSGSGGSIDLGDLGAADFLLSAADLVNKGLGGNWMIRATGTSITPPPDIAVAEPGAFALLLVGLLGLRVVRRERPT